MAAKRTYIPPPWIFILIFIGWMVLLIDKGLWFVPVLIVVAFIALISYNYFKNTKKSSKQNIGHEFAYMGNHRISDSGSQEFKFETDQKSLYQSSTFLFFLTKNGKYECVALNDSKDLFRILKELNTSGESFEEIVFARRHSMILALLDDSSVFKVKVVDLINRLFEQRKLPIGDRKILRVFEYDSEKNNKGVYVVMATKMANYGQRSLHQVVDFASDILAHYETSKILNRFNKELAETGIFNPPNSEIMAVTFKGRVIRSNRSKIDHKKLIELYDGDYLTSMATINKNDLFILIIDKYRAKYKLVPIDDFRFTSFGGRGVKIGLGIENQFVPEKILSIGDINDIIIIITRTGKILQFKTSKLNLSTRMSEPIDFPEIGYNDKICMVKTLSNLTMNDKKS